MLTIELQKGDTPLYEQIYNYIKSEINEGRLAEGEKLPGSRALAAHLDVSRNTVQMAYDQLTSEGYIHAKDRSGYVVDAVIPSASRKIISRPLPEAHSSQKIDADIVCDFSPYRLNSESFPYATWQRLNRRILAEHGSDIFSLGARQGEFELRSAIANYLEGMRGFSVSPDNIIICAGADYSFQLLTQLLGVPACIAMENPGYLQAYKIFNGFGVNVVPIEVDEKGANTDMLAGTNASAIYVTPSHEYPLGTVMSAGRRRRLLQMAEASGKYIIEDDHDSEFRYKGKLIPALKELDSCDKVVYLGTFSRTIAPAIRAGYMVLPDSLLAIYKKKFSYYACTVSRIDQLILAAFINEGYYERHLSKSRKIYRSRHDALIDSLKSAFPDCKVLDEDAGLHITVMFDNGLSEEEMIKKAREKGVLLHGLSEFTFSETHTAPGLVFGFGGLTEAEIENAIKLIRF